MSQLYKQLTELVEANYPLEYHERFAAPGTKVWIRALAQLVEEELDELKYQQSRILGLITNDGR
jgi:FMN phosphatase YigB (HAD superfamily)